MSLEKIVTCIFLFNIIVHKLERLSNTSLRTQVSMLTIASIPKERFIDSQQISRSAVYRIKDYAKHKKVRQS